VTISVLAVTNMYPTAETPAAGTFIERQIEGLRRAGEVDVEVLHIDRLGRGMAVYRGLAERIRGEIDRSAPDLVHVMYGGVLADVVTRAAGAVPTVVSFCGSDLLGEPADSIARRVAIRFGVAASRRAARRALGIVVKSRNLRDALPEGTDPRRVWTIPNGVDLQRFHPMDADECRARLGWNGPPERLHVLFPSHPGHPRKRYPLALAAVDRLHASGRDVELHTLGAVPHPEIPVWINASDCVLLTSTHEGSPNIVKEALACDRAVVAVDVGDVAERLERIDGCFVTGPTTRELSLALDEVRERGGRIDGRSRVRDLSIERVARRLLEVYRAIVPEASRARAAP
jgi:glycosyltransferase involved in cell wall biosynthesis